MTDYTNNIKAKRVFDISNHTIEPASYKGRIGNREFCIHIKETYNILWKEREGFYFLEI